MDDFKEIPGYEGLYQVDKNGNVYSLQTSRYLKPSISRAGYKQYVLHKNHMQHCMLAHRAVALAFISRESDDLVVNHKDENKLNCNVDNLEWVTRKENNNYMGNRAAEASKKKFSKEFYAFTKNGELIGKYIGVNEYAKANSMSPGNLSTILTKNSESANKYSYRGVIYTYENK